MSDHDGSDPFGSSDARFEVAEDGDVTTIVLAGSIDASSGPSLGPSLRDVVRERAEAGRLVLVDLGGVDFIDSVGLNLLIGAHEMVRELGGSMELINVSARCRRVLEITHLDTVFVIRP